MHYIYLMERNAANTPADTDKAQQGPSALSDQDLQGVSGAGFLGRIGKVFSGLGKLGRKDDGNG